METGTGIGELAESVEDGVDELLTDAIQELSAASTLGSFGKHTCSDHERLHETNKVSKINSAFVKASTHSCWQHPPFR